MSCVRIASNSPHIFTCILLTLLLNAGLAHAATPSKPSNNVIRIWTVGSPHTGELPSAEVPSDLRKRAENLGYTIEIEAFKASGFADRFRQAVQLHNEPEILTFDNFGIIIGMQTVFGWIDGIDVDHQTAPSLALVHETMTSLQSRGWVMLVRSSVNYEAAHALAMRPAKCLPQCGRAADMRSIEPTLRQAQEKAVAAARAYVGCDRSELSAISDESRLGQQCFLPKSEVKVESVKVCSVSGNDKLAFVSLVSGFSATTGEANTLRQGRHGTDLGQRTILAVLRNQNGNWRLLAITHDVMNTVAPISLTATNAFVNSLDHGPTAGIAPYPARPVTPDGVYPRPAMGERFGDFIWEQSHSTDVIGQVVEFTWGNDTNWNLTRLFFLPASENKVSSGYLMSGGASTWRVWSISSAGHVAFSEQHSYRH